MFSSRFRRRLQCCVKVLELFELSHWQTQMMHLRLIGATTTLTVLANKTEYMFCLAMHIWTCFPIKRGVITSSFRKPSICMVIGRSVVSTPSPTWAHDIRCENMKITFITVYFSKSASVDYDYYKTVENFIDAVNNNRGGSHNLVVHLTWMKVGIMNDFLHSLMKQVDVFLK